jgi:hypothetical protein
VADKDDKQELGTFCFHEMFPADEQRGGDAATVSARQFKRKNLFNMQQGYGGVTKAQLRNVIGQLPMRSFVVMRPKARSVIQCPLHDDKCDPCMIMRQVEIDRAHPTMDGDIPHRFESVVAGRLWESRAIARQGSLSGGVRGR